MCWSRCVLHFIYYILVFQTNYELVPRLVSNRFQLHIRSVYSQQFKSGKILYFSIYPVESGGSTHFKRFIYIFIFYFLGLWHLSGRKHGCTDVHGVHIDPAHIDRLDKEFKTPGTVLLHRHLLHHREFCSDLLLYFPRNSVIRRPWTSRHNQKHTIVFWHRTICHGSYRHGKRIMILNFIHNQFGTFFSFLRRCVYVYVSHLD